MTTQMDGPLVSILMTVYNREEHIADAIESVLASTYTNFELIVVDDCSKDRSVEIATQYANKDQRISIYRNEKNLGDYPNRNKAAEYAKGKYIKYVDADDMIYYYGLEVMVKFTEHFPDAGFGLGTFPDNEHPLPILLSPREIYIESFSKTNHFDRAPGSGLIKRDAFNAVGGFSGKRMVGDYEFWFKISRYYSMVKLPLDLYWNRIHDGQESQSEYAKKNYAQLKKQILEENLDHADCPLNKEERERFKKQIKAQYFRRKMIRIVSKAKNFLPK